MSLPTVVIGGGIAGLTAALRLQQAGSEVRLLEASQHMGGAIASARQGGHLFEQGPTTVMSTAEHLGRLIDDVDLRSRALLSRPLAGRRLVWRRGRLSALPEKPPQLLRCQALSPVGRARLLLEPLMPSSSQLDETLESFGHRRLGREATAAFLEPFVTGVFAGRIDQLGTDALPRLQQLEEQHGSLLRGMLAARKKAKAKANSRGDNAPAGPAPLISFAEGLQELPDRLVQRLEELGARVSRGHEVVELRRLDDRFEIDYQDSTGTRPQQSLQQLQASAVVIATPAAIAGSLLRPLLSSGFKAADFLDQVPHPPLATIGLGFRRQDVAHPLDAFGLLCAADSPITGCPGILGVLFTSSIFEGRAAADEISLTAMVGGARHPEAAEADDDELLVTVQKALTHLIGVRGTPTTSTIRRWPRSIPQYLPGHRHQIEGLRQTVEQVPHLALAGNYLDGPGLEAAVASGDQAASLLTTAAS